MQLSRAAISRCLKVTQEVVSNKLRDMGCTLRELSICGHNNPNWKGGRMITNKGASYVYIYAPNHPNKTANNNILEHRFVMEQHLKRYLTPEEIVHHINHIKNDNRIENLALVSKAEHAHIHFDEIVPTRKRNSKGRFI